MALRLGRALVVLALAAGLLVLVSPASTAAPALVLSRAQVIPGESVVITGGIGKLARRPVVLQRRAGTRWVKVQTAKTRVKGAFRFTWRPPSTLPNPTRIRVLAPATKLNGKRLAAVATVGRNLARLTPTARITGPQHTVTEESFTVAAAFSPPRVGRATEVQRWTGTAWATLASGKQDGAGRTTFDVALTDAGDQRLRVRTLAAAGAAAHASSDHAITAIPPEEDTRPPKPPTGLVATATDRAIELRWDPTTVSNRRGRHLYIASKLDGPWARLTNEPLGPDETSYVVRGLANGVDYVFGVTSLYQRTGGLVESEAAFTGTVVPVAPAPGPTGDEGPDACGERMFKENGTAWRCTLADYFDGTTFDRTHWFPQQTFASGTPAKFACYVNTPDTISVAGGVLSLSVIKVAQPVSCSFGKLSGSTDIIAGSLMTYQRFTQRYGRFEARIKSTPTLMPGLQEAFWMWPDDRLPSTEPWPIAGEIDVTETYSHLPYLSVPYLHYRADLDGPQPGVNTSYCLALRGEWNTYTMVWAPDRIEIQVNGETCLVNTSGDSAFDKPYLMALTAMLGSGDNAYDGRAPLPATMQVDYVRVWE